MHLPINILMGKKKVKMDKVMKITSTTTTTTTSQELFKRAPKVQVYIIRKWTVACPTTIFLMQRTKELAGIITFKSSVALHMYFIRKLTVDSQMIL